MSDEEIETRHAEIMARREAWINCINNWIPKHENRPQHSDYLVELLAANQGA